MTLLRQQIPVFALAALLATPCAALAHVHGQVQLDVAIEGPTIVIAMTTPLDNVVGFERAARTEAEKKTADDAVARLRAAAELFRIDPVANCKQGPVTLHSEALGLGKDKSGQGAGEGHAELEASFAFNCTNAAAAKFIDIGLFEAFKGARQVEAQIAAPQGQFKRTLKRPATRLAWGK